jgi:hypothetical protein
MSRRKILPADLLAAVRQKFASWPRNYPIMLQDQRRNNA